jgi:hypothetical protein
VKLLYTGASACNGDTLGRLFLLGSELCFLDRPSVTFGNWGTIGHQSNLRRFSSEGLPLKISVHSPPSGSAQGLYAPFVEADLANPTFIKIVLDGLANDPSFAEKLLPLEANYGGLTGTDLRNRLAADLSLYAATFSIDDQDDPQLLYRPDTREGRVAIAKTTLVNVSIEVTSALITADVIEALPIADDKTFPQLLALRSSGPQYVGGTSSFAPYLGLQFANSVIPDEMLQKIDFKGIFEYRRNSKDVYEAWMNDLNQVAVKISDADASNPSDAARKIIATDLLPKVQEYEREMISIRDRLFGDLVKKVVSWELPTISVAYFTDLSRIDALSLFETAIKAGAVLAGTAKSIVEPIVDYQVSKRALKRKHAVSYIVGLTKR